MPLQVAVSRITILHPQKRKDHVEIPLSSIHKKMVFDLEKGQVQVGNTDIALMYGDSLRALTDRIERAFLSSSDFIGWIRKIRGKEFDT